MKELIEFIIKNLVGNPDSVEVKEEDFGKIIGRSGKVATAIRTVVKTSAKKNNKRVFVKFEK